MLTSQLLVSLRVPLSNETIRYNTFRRMPVPVPLTGIQPYSTLSINGLITGHLKDVHRTHFSGVEKSTKGWTGRIICLLTTNVEIFMSITISLFKSNLE